ncbi:hypothetical protein K493DRAFT_309070 [Basidiobolus meristosporus CBS 931.73]|nr:hypothetical protein K493DRAFT_309070 [Basidiobolus meristosporus CBS 931.73]|eukprot:ORX76141.1 hypothetical protein K493DRAFT_309070 [Basidiobolus meristosporus CBS 931.73]
MPSLSIPLLPFSLEPYEVDQLATKLCVSHPDILRIMTAGDIVFLWSNRRRLLGVFDFDGTLAGLGGSLTESRKDFLRALNHQFPICINSAQALGYLLENAGRDVFAAISSECGVEILGIDGQVSSSNTPDYSLYLLEMRNYLRLRGWGKLRVNEKVAGFAVDLRDVSPQVYAAVCGKVTELASDSDFRCVPTPGYVDLCLVSENKGKALDTLKKQFPD